MVLLDATLRIDFFHGSYHLGRSSRTQSCHLTALGERDGLVGMYLDELGYDALVGTDTSIAVFFTNIAFTVSLQQGIGEHA